MGKPKTDGDYCRVALLYVCIALYGAPTVVPSVVVVGIICNLPRVIKLVRPVVRGVQYVARHEYGS
jgi:hypothetical protein